MNIRTIAAAALLLAGTAASPALAQDESEGWRVSLTPYLWVVGVSGDVTAPFPLPGRDVEADFGDVLDHLDGVFLGKAEIQYDRFGVFGDIAYMGLSGGETRNPENLPSIGTKMKLDMTTATVAGFYRVVDGAQWDVDLIAGLRYNKVKTDLDVTLGGPGRSAKVSRDFTDPIIGVRGNFKTGPKGSITGLGDYGGFGGDSTVWQLLGTYNYQWKKSVIVSGGYRYYAIDLDKDHFQYDLALHGPILGLTFVF